MKVFLFPAMLLVTIAASAQHEFSEQNDEYSRKLKRKAWLLTGGGSVLLAGGSLLLAKGHKSDNNAQVVLGTGMLASGSLSLLGSIPVFVGASRSKERTPRLSLTKEKFPLLRSLGYRMRTRPALALRIPL